MLRAIKNSPWQECGHPTGPHRATRERQPIQLDTRRWHGNRRLRPRNRSGTHQLAFQKLGISQWSGLQIDRTREFIIPTSILRSIGTHRTYIDYYNVDYLYKAIPYLLSDCMGCINIYDYHIPLVTVYVACLRYISLDCHSAESAKGLIDIILHYLFCVWVRFL